VQQVINFNLPLRLIDARSKYSSLRSNISKCEKNKRCMWCDRKARAACVWSFTLWHQATIDIACHDHSWRTLLLRSVVHIVSITRDYTPRSLFYCLFAPHIYGCYSSRTSRSWWITHSTQRQRRGCNNIPSFLQRAAPFTRFFREVCTWHDLHILVAAPFWCDRKGRAACAHSFTLRQQATTEIACHDHSLRGCHTWNVEGVA